MSTISGSCGSSEAQLLFERGIQEQQAQRLQQNRALEAVDNGQQGGSAISLSPTLEGQVSPVEPNKGIHIDLYA